MKRPTIAAVLVAGAALLAAPLAVAAPPAGQDEGSRVIVKEAAAGVGSCTVTPVQPLRVRELPRSGGVGPAAALTPAVHVGVQC